MKEYFNVTWVLVLLIKKCVHMYRLPENFIWSSNLFQNPHFLFELYKDTDLNDEM